LVKYRLTTDYITVEFYGKYQVEEVVESIVGSSDKSPAFEDKFQEQSFDRSCHKCNCDITMSNKTGKWKPYEGGSGDYHICKNTEGFGSGKLTS